MMVEFDISIKSQDLYDYNLYHAFHSVSKLLCTAFGIFGLIYGIETKYYPLAIIGGLLAFYLPVTLWLRSKQTYALTPAFKKPLHYVIDGNGITVSQGEESQCASWDEVYKAVSTNRSIIVYTSPVNASVFPKNQLGDKKAMLIQEISVNLDPKKVKIRN